jgi:Protein of unknown function (DUF3987)
VKIVDIPQALLDATQLQLTGETDWSEPEEISRALSPVPPFHPQMLPKLLRRRADDIAHRMQCPVDFVATGMIVMIGSVIGSRCAIRPKHRDDWTEYPNLWGAVIAPPGALKTPAISQALSPIACLERRAAAEYDVAVISQLADKFAREANLNALQDQLKKQRGNGTALGFGNPIYQQMADLKMGGSEPQLKRYRTNDATVEKLADLCSVNPQGLLVWRDELVGLLASCTKEGHEGDRAFYLEGWNGCNSFRQDRIGRGSINVERLCLSLFGTIQPLRLQSFMYGMDGLQHDGMLQRFQLMVYPDLPRNRKVVDEIPDEVSQKAVEGLIEKLAYMDFEAMGASEGEGRSAPFFRFDKHAQNTFYQWLVELDDRIVREDSPLMKEHLSKYRKLVPAIALILHLVAIAETDRPTRTVNRRPRAVNRCHLQRAFTWAKYLEAHARRIFGQATDLRLIAARALQKRLADGKLNDGFSERDVYRAGWSQLEGHEIVKDACAELVAGGWIRRIIDTPVTKPQSPRYQINPKIFEK